MEVLDILQGVTSFQEAKSRLTNLNLIVKEYPELDLYLVKYDKSNCDMNHPDVLKCRGLIARMSDNSVVCYPPVKSIPYISDNIEWNKVIVEDFIDGTMINLFYHNNEWMISTRSSIGAKCRWESKKYFYELFNESNKEVDLSILDKSNFYTFVLLHPENTIVTKYTTPSVVLVSVGTISNNNYINLDIHSITSYTGYKIMRYNFQSYDEAYNYVSKLNYEKQGLVLKYGNNMQFRSKIRNSNYNYVKLLKGNTNNLKFLYFELLKEKKYKEYLSFFPEKKELFDNFYKEFTTLVKNILFNYRQFHKYKKINIKQMPFKLRPLCFEIHNLYINTYNRNTDIDFGIIYEYLLSIDIPRILFSLNEQ
jgi:hypothetical protein